MADEGASPRELVLEACRRNNTDLLEEVISNITKSAKSTKESARQVALLLNTAQDGIGNGVLHIAASSGSYDVLDILLDQEGLEIDHLDRLEGDTPLHKAVRYVNDLAGTDWQGAQAIVDILLDAGCDPKIRNKAKLKPYDLVDPRNTGLRMVLQRAEFASMAGDDIVDEDANDRDDGVTGSPSDSE